MGAEFRDAAWNSLEPNDSKVTTIQAFVVMHLIDCACGNALRVAAYLQVATFSLPRVTYQENDGFAESWEAITVRGIKNLNMLVYIFFGCLASLTTSSEWGQMTFQVPSIIESATYNSIEEVNAIFDNTNWYSYRFAKE